MTIFDFTRRIRRILPLSASIATAAVFVSCLPGCEKPQQESPKPQPAEAHWFTSWDKAHAEAEKTGKPILIDFTGKEPSGAYWCPPCEQLTKTVFKTKVFVDWAEENVVLLEVASPQSVKPTADAIKLMRKYQISQLPTVLVVRPNGNVIYESGFDPRQTAADWVRNAKRSVKPPRAKETGTSK